MLIRAFSIRAKLFFILSTLGFLLLGSVAAGWLSTISMHASINTIYEHRLVPLRDLKVVADLYAVNIVDASHKVRNDNMSWAEGLQGVEAARTGIAKSWTAYVAGERDANERVLVKEAENLMRHADKVVDKLTDILKTKDRAALAAFTTGDLYPAIDPLSESVSKLVELQLETAKAEGERAERTYALLKIAFGIIVFAALANLLFAGWSVVSGIARPLTRITGQMQKLAGGDLQVVVTDTHKGDEIGTLGRALQVFKDALIAKGEADRAAKVEADAKVRRAQVLDGLTRRFETNVSSLTHALAAAATEMEATAQTMTATAGQTTSQSVGVASAAEKTLANVQTVAVATEELSSSIREIAEQVGKSSAIAGRATEEARRTDATVQALANGAQKIGDVVSLISTIAGQTNLLALNATIEAARAGEAGRGFAVVATEVKELASQTGKATEEIASQIAAIQEETKNAVLAIQTIAATISEMNTIASGVAAAMEEQGAATQEIARNVQQAAQGTQVVTGNILDVKRGAGETGSAAAQVLAAAQELARHSENLGREVDGFLSGVKAA